MRGATPTSMSIGRISSAPRPSGRFLSTAIRLPDHVLLELVEGELDGRALLAVVVGLRVAGERLERLLLDLLGRVLALELVLDLGGLLEGGAEAVLELGEDRLVHLRRLDLDLVLAGLLLQLALRLADALDLAVGDVERVEDHGLGDLVGAGLDHEDGLLAARDDQVERALEQRLLVGVDDEAAVLVLGDAHGADGHREGDVGDHQRGARAVHREDVVGVVVVDRHRDRDELRLARSSPSGRAGAAAGRSCARSGWPSRRPGPRGGRSCRGSCPRRTCAPRRPRSAGGSPRRAGCLRWRWRGPWCPLPGPRPLRSPVGRAFRSRRRSRFHRAPPRPALHQTCGYSFQCRLRLATLC